MPVKLGLVFIKRQEATPVVARQINYKPEERQHPQKRLNEPSVQPKVASIENKNSKGLSLRRIMNAPNTSCKRCGG
jgi:hypothetical protein